MVDRGKAPAQQLVLPFAQQGVPGASTGKGAVICKGLLVKWLSRSSYTVRRASMPTPCVRTAIIAWEHMWQNVLFLHAIHYPALAEDMTAISLPVHVTVLAPGTRIRAGEHERSAAGQAIA